ncbi:UNVERIFIED_CONTAM: hypothetical protein Slati_1258400 [Sesamum latifolium]|uniref:Uncharacterized protein n=1 Tax=Sesamum latifolium TaxID=2727402 RepID=A0AAW2XFQ7_9LAMI
MLQEILIQENSRIKPGYSVPFVPDRNVHSLNKNFDDMNAFAQSQPHCHPTKFNRGFVPEYDLLLAPRNAIMLQHRRSLLLEGGSTPMNRGAYLPQEWTY